MLGLERASDRGGEGDAKKHLLRCRLSQICF